MTLQELTLSIAQRAQRPLPWLAAMSMMARAPRPALRSGLFQPGQRIAVAVSGGADSVALLRRMLEERSSLGLGLSVVHVNHGIRGPEADGDAEFVAALAAEFDLPIYLYRVDAPAAAAQQHESLEEASRRLRYACFERAIAERAVTAIATAHTLNDQAETVLSKLLRGAWTEGMSGIHPVLAVAGGAVLRPFLDVTRSEIEAWLRSLGQPWREDASNWDMAHTRNRIRRELLPLLTGFNPEIARQLSRLAAISADEEDYWQVELRRLLPSLLLPGRPTRGGGRSNSSDPEGRAVAIEIERLKQLHPAVRRRVLRAAARQLGFRLSFDHTESLLALGDRRAAGRKLELPGGLVAARTLRELRLSRDASPPAAPEYSFVLPGEVSAPAFGLRLRGERFLDGPPAPAVLRNWKPGDRVTLRYRRSPKKVAEMLDRLHIVGEERKLWPVVEAEGRIVWMRGLEVDAPGFAFTVTAES